jgi:catechol 2,3-dioxygenase-like lactoylglutathione lyase family enzyme
MTPLRSSLLVAAAVLTIAARATPPLQVRAVGPVGFTVADMNRSIAFYRDTLGFTPVSDVEVGGRAYELLTGVFGARARVVRMRLGGEDIELTEFLAPKGRRMPDDVRANDRVFQHIAIVVRDMDAAYRHLRSRAVEHASTSPQRLPDWNPGAAGIQAFYFRDPDRHFLEVIAFPPGKGQARWQQASDRIFIGIDHTAIVVGDTEASLRLYRDTFGLRVVGQGENHDVEQEHLNNVFGARLRITTLRAREGPGIELLEYLAPRDGRPPPPDLRANDIAHWQTTLMAAGLDALLPLARTHQLALVSPAVIDGASPLDAHQAALVRDGDGHGLLLRASR